MKFWNYFKKTQIGKSYCSCFRRPLEKKNYNRQKNNAAFSPLNFLRENFSSTPFLIRTKTLPSTLKILTKILNKESIGTETKKGKSFPRKTSREKAMQRDRWRSSEEVEGRSIAFKKIRVEKCEEKEGRMMRRRKEGEKEGEEKEKRKELYTVIF